MTQRGGLDLYGASASSVARVPSGSYDRAMSPEPVTRIKSKTPVPYELTAIHHDTHDTKTFCFALPDEATLDMLPGDYLYVHATIDGKTVKRPYTPSSMPGATGYFDLTVKRYDTGTISKYLHDREIGDTVLMSGPNPGGHWVDGMAKQVGCVAGGTGITPMIAIIRWILAKSLGVELFLVFANKTEADIIFREEWDEDEREHANFHCYHVLEQPPAGWWQGTGRITEAMLRGHLPPPGPDTVIFLCGPPPMADALEASLKAIGYSEHAIILP
jgi:cytochrome-b5 reductase